MKYKLLRLSLLGILAMFFGAVHADYEKVTSTAAISSGDYLIVCEAGNVAFNGALETLDATENTVPLEIADGKIAASSGVDAAIFTIDTENGTVKSASGKYIGITSNSNGLKPSDNATAYTHTFSIDADGNAVIAAVFDGSTMTMRFNAASNQMCFRYYKSGQQAVQLYKKTEGGVADNRIATTVTVGDAQTGEAGSTMNLPVAVVTGADGAPVEGATVTWASSDAKVAAIDGTVLQLLTAGEATITATYAGDNTYKGSRGSFKVTVTAAAIDETFTSLKALQEAVTSTSTPVTIQFNNVFVTAVKGSNAYLADADGYGILVYQKDHGLQAGQVLNGTISASLVLYRGQTEITGFSAQGLTVTTTELTPTEKTIGQITAANQSTLVTLKGVSYSDGKLSDGTNEITYYDNFGVKAEFEEGATYDLTGIVIVFNTTLEIAPRTADDIVKADAAGQPTEEYVYRDFAVQLTNSDILDTSVNTFGVKVAEDGSYTATAADDAAANFTVSAARFNDKDHGWVNCTFTIPVEGPVKVGLGNCQYGSQDGTITDSEGNVTALTVGNSNCWHNNTQENISYTVYKGTEPTTLTIKYNGYCPFISCEKVNPADLLEDATVTFAAGEAADAVVPAALTMEVGKTFTLPKNFTMYVEGKTMTAWTDGTSDFAPGAEYTVPANDVTLTAKFTDNEVSLNDRTEAVTVKFDFMRQDGAPTVAYQNQAGRWVAQANVGGKTIDVKADFDTNNGGKFANGNWNDWAQLNGGTKWTVPSCKGAVISMEAYSDITTTTIDGQTDYTQGKTISYTIAGSAETVDVVIGDGSYYRYIQVLLPKAEQQQGGDAFDHVAGTVQWPLGNEQQPVVSDDMADAISSASVSTGSEMTVSTAKYFDTDMVHYTPQNSNAGNVEGVMIEYRVKPAKGVTFQPTQIDYAAVKVGTDNATYSWSYTADGEESAITQIDPKPNLLRNNGSNGTAEYGGTGTAKLMHTETFEGVGECSEFTFRFYISACANNKNICIGNVTISGIANGESVSVNMYDLATTVAPEEAGSINVYPAGEQYEEGTEVTLTATENFGYDFVNWTNAAGEEVAQEAKFKYTVIANETLTANFVAVKTYELALTVDGTNDYMVTVEPAPTMIDGKMMYEDGQAVQLTANQYEGLVTFTNWSDGDTRSSKLVSMTADTQLTAMYAQADIIAGWDFHKAGGSGRKADFYAQDNDGDALNLVETATGETSGWLDKSYLGAGGYESFKGAAVNWRTGTGNGDVGNWHWQTKVNAEAFTDINVQFQMLYNYNAYQRYNVECSTDGDNWTKVGDITMTGAKAPASFNGQLPAEANNQAELYIRMIADKTSTVDGAESANDGNALAMFFITGLPKLVDDGTAPVLVSTVPENGATGASATGKIVLTFDERVKAAEGAAATLGNQTLTPAVSGKIVTFEYKGLEYSTRYTFALPAGSIADMTGNATTEDITLTFTTMTRPSVEKKLYDYVVENADDLVAAIAAAQARTDKNTRYRIFVKNGHYTIPLKDNTLVAKAEGYEVPECITFINTQNLSIVGESRDGVVITNGIDPTNLFNGQYGKTSKYDGIGNSDVLQISGSDYYFQDITIESGMDDATGRDLAVQDKATRTVYKNTGLRGFQDTWTSNNDYGLYYFEGGYVRGRTDYMCGKGDAFFNGVELRQIAGGYAAVPSKSIKYGFTYKDCVINGEPATVNYATGETRTAADADGSYTLGRPWGSGTPVALFIDTKMSVVPSAIGWSEMSGGFPRRFAEYNSTTATGSQIDLSGRKRTFGDGHDNNPVLTAEEALEAGNLHNMFGEWDPTLLTEQAPIPTNVTLDKDSKTLTWTGSDYALLYAIVKDGKVVDFTTGSTYTVDDATATYAVRAANEMGGLSEASAAAAVTTTAISELASSERAMPETVCNIGGIRVQRAQRGLYIVNGRKVVVR